MRGLLAAALLALAWPAHAREAGSSFLNIGTGARPEALAGAYTALAEDVHALHYNPAGLAGMARPEAAATHAQWLLGSQFDFVGYGQPTRFGTVGLSLSRLASGAIEGRGADRKKMTSYDAVDTAYALGLGRSAAGLLPGGRSRVGASAKLLERRVGDVSGSGLAFDLGIAHELSARPLTVGLSVLNLGQGIRFLDQTDPLPLTVAAGVSARLSGVAAVSLDVRHDAVGGTNDVAIGTEYAVLPGLALRAGYASETAIGHGSPIGGLGGGLGLRLGRYRADYAFTPFALGNVQRLSLGVKF